MVGGGAGGGGAGGGLRVDQGQFVLLSLSAFLPSAINPN